MNWSDQDFFYYHRWKKLNFFTLLFTLSFFCGIMATQAFLYWLKVCCHSSTDLCRCAEVGSLLAKKNVKKMSVTLFYLNVKLLRSSRHTSNSQPCWWMQERLPLPWKLARSLLSKQMRVSWCGLSFPLCWRCCSTKVRGVWEKPVRERREEMCIYLRWWGMISALICLQSSTRIALHSSRSREVTISASKGWGWG